MGRQTTSATPGPVRRSARGEDKTRISWEAVEVADFYNVYVGRITHLDDCDDQPDGMAFRKTASINCEFLERIVIDTGHS